MNRLKWGVQHGILKFEDPPYVYNVFKGDQEGFVQAIKDAINTPIDRYIIPRMAMKAVESRLKEILDADWHKEAENLLAERQRKGQGVVCTSSPVPTRALGLHPLIAYLYRFVLPLSDLDDVEQRLWAIYTSPHTTLATKYQLSTFRHRHKPRAD